MRNEHEVKWNECAFCLGNFTLASTLTWAVNVLLFRAVCVLAAFSACIHNFANACSASSLRFQESHLLTFFIIKCCLKNVFHNVFKTCYIILGHFTCRTRTTVVRSRRCKFDLHEIIHAVYLGLLRVCPCDKITVYLFDHRGIEFTCSALDLL